MSGWLDNAASAKDAHTLIPRNCEYITLHGKGNYPDG